MKRVLVMKPDTDKVVILDQRGIEQGIKEIAHQVISRHKSISDIALVGIRTGGAFLAFRLRDEIVEKDEEKPLTGVLDINFYRDDWTTVGLHSQLGSTEIPFSIDNKIIVYLEEQGF